MRYAEGSNLNPGVAGVLSTHVMAANSIYDPNTSGTGHQPLGYDELAVFYDHYMVVRSKVTATFTSSDLTVSAPATVGIFLTDVSSLTATDPNTIVEQNRAVHRLYPYPRETALTLSKVFTAKKFFNYKDDKDNLRTYGASFGLNPTEGAFFVVFAGNQHSADTALIYVNILVEYDVLVSEPDELAAS